MGPVEAAGNRTGDGSVTVGIIDVEATPSDLDYTQAEAIVRPYLANGAAVFGVLPDHRFREMDCIPMQLVADIAQALMRARAQGV